MVDIMDDTRNRRLNVERKHADAICEDCQTVVFAANLMPDANALTRELAIIRARDFHARTAHPSA